MFFFFFEENVRELQKFLKLHIFRRDTLFKLELLVKNTMPKSFWKVSLNKIVNFGILDENFGNH